MSDIGLSKVTTRMRVQLEPDLSATNVSMVPAEIEALPESKVLVSNPPPNYEYTIITEVLSDFMRHNQGVAMAFDLLGQKMAERGFNCKRDVGIVKMKGVALSLSYRLPHAQQLEAPDGRAVGNGSEVKDQTLDLWQGREPL
ncbi:hypothetical protein CF328_g729 [Tilletia controversa]|nr:hypothetical protein CF328_g729 [Tilletia controversa]